MHPSPAAHLAMGGTLSRWERDLPETFRIALIQDVGLAKLFGLLVCIV